MWEARLRSEPAWLPPPPAPSPRHPLVRSLQHLRHLGIHRLPRGGALLLAHGHCTQAEGQRRASAARVAARVGAEGKRFGAEPLRSRQAEGAADPGADALPSFSARSCPSALREEVTLPAGCPSSARSREGEPRAAPSPLLLPSPGPMRSLMPHSATMWRAMRVACRRSLVAPEVTWSSPNTSSSAALPPMHTSMWARSCWRVVEYSSLSGTWLTMPSAWPRGTMVAWGGEKGWGGGEGGGDNRQVGGERSATSVPPCFMSQVRDSWHGGQRRGDRLASRPPLGAGPPPPSRREAGACLVDWLGAGGVQRHQRVSALMVCSQPPSLLALRAAAG
jgi:hypothetical protein